VTTRIAPSAALEAAIEEGVTAFLGRARYERAPEARLAEREPSAQVQTAEGELEVQVPQVRGAAEKFVSSVIPNGRTALPMRPLEALIIGGWGRGLSDRDFESLASEAGLGQVSKSTVSQITKELRARYQAFRACGLGEVELLVLFCDAIYLPTRPSCAKEGVLVAWRWRCNGTPHRRRPRHEGACAARWARTAAHGDAREQPSPSLSPLRSERPDLRGLRPRRRRTV